MKRHRYVLMNCQVSYEGEEGATLVIDLTEEDLEAMDAGDEAALWQAGRPIVVIRLAAGEVAA